MPDRGFKSQLSKVEEQGEAVLVLVLMKGWRCLARGKRQQGSAVVAITLTLSMTSLPCLRAGCCGKEVEHVAYTCDNVTPATRARGWYLTDNICLQLQFQCSAFFAEKNNILSDRMGGAKDRPLVAKHVDGSGCQRQQHQNEQDWHLHIRSELQVKGWVTLCYVEQTRLV